MAFEEIPITNMLYGGFIISYSREMVLNSDGTVNMETGTTPDVDMVKDKCIQAVI